MRSMTKNEKIRYDEIVADSKQLCFDADMNAVEENPLYICIGKFNQYYFSTKPDEAEK